MPRSLVLLGAAGAVAVVAMAFAPQVGRLDPRGGFTDAIVPGTDGTAHYAGPETGRRVDVQLLSVTRPTTLPAGVTATAGREVLAVRLRLAAAHGDDIAGCRVELVAKDGTVASEPVPGAPGCGARLGGPGEVEGRSTVLVSVPAGVHPTQVRVMWQPPAYVVLPVV